jgi:hypothetical protein
MERPVKNIGKSKTTGESASGAAALKPIRDCRAKGWHWDQSAGKCTKPSEAKANCESKGPNYSYDLDTGGCVKQQASDDDDDDYKPKKKKKKTRHHDSEKWLPKKSASDNYEHLKCYPICRDQCIAARSTTTWEQCIKDCLIGTRCE